MNYVCCNYKHRFTKYFVATKTSVKTLYCIKAAISCGGGLLHANHKVRCSIPVSSTFICLLGKKTHTHTEKKTGYKKFMYLLAVVCCCPSSSEM